MANIFGHIHAKYSHHYNNNSMLNLCLRKKKLKSELWFAQISDFIIETATHLLVSVDADETYVWTDAFQYLVAICVWRGSDSIFNLKRTPVGRDVFIFKVVSNKLCNNCFSIDCTNKAFSILSFLFSRMVIKTV